MLVDKDSLPCCSFPTLSGIQIIRTGSCCKPLPALYNIHPYPVEIKNTPSDDFTPFPALCNLPRTRILLDKDLGLQLPTQHCFRSCSHR